MGYRCRLGSRCREVIFSYLEFWWFSHNSYLENYIEIISQPKFTAQWISRTSIARACINNLPKVFRADSHNYYLLNIWMLIYGIFIYINIYVSISILSSENPYILTYLLWSMAVRVSFSTNFVKFSGLHSLGVIISWGERNVIEFGPSVLVYARLMA